MTYIPTKYQSRSALPDGGIISVVIINFVIGMLALFLFSFVHYRSVNRGTESRGTRALRSAWRWRREKSKRDPEEVESVELMENAIRVADASDREAYLAWLVRIFRMSDEELVRRCGNDGMVYLHFQRMTLYLLLVLSVCALAVILPVNVMGGHLTKGGFDVTTIANVGDPNWYWVHAVATDLFSLAVLAYIFLLRRFLVRNKEAFRNRHSSVSSHSVMLSHVPAELVDSGIFRRHFEDLLKTNELQEWLRLRARLRLLSQGLDVEDAAAGFGVGGGMGGGDDDDDDDDEVQDAIMENIDIGELGRRRSHAAGAAGPAARRNPKGSSLLLLDDDDEDDDGDDDDGHGYRAQGEGERRKKKRREAEGDGGSNSSGIVAVHIAHEVGKLAQVQRQLELAQARLNYYIQLQMLMDERPQVARPCFLPSYDPIELYQRQVTALSREVQRERVLVQQRRATGVVFVTFSSSALAKAVLADYRRYHSALSWAHRAAHTVNGRAVGDPRRVRLTKYSQRLRDAHWVVSPAPEPEDVLWTNLGVGYWERWLRFLYINLLVVAVVVFWTSPLSILQALASLPVLGEWWSDLTSTAIYTAFLSSLLLLVLTVSLPNVLWVSSWLEAHQTETAEHKSLVVKTYLYLLFNVLVLPSLFQTSITSIFEEVYGYRDRAFVLLDGIFTDRMGPFFVNYIIQLGVLGTVVEAMRLPERLIKAWKSFRAKSDVELNAARAYAYRHEFGMQYAFLLTILSTVLMFSTTIPVVLPAGVVYFACKHVLDRYHLVYVRPRTFESDGSMVWVVLRCIFAALIMFECAVAVFMLLHGTVGQFVAVLIPPMFISLFVCFNSLSAVNLFTFTVLPKHSTYTQPPEEVRMAYRDPLLKKK